MAAKLLIAQREWTVLRRFVKPHQSTRWADGWVGFPCRVTECDLGHDGGLRGSVGKRTPEYNTRSPFFLAAKGSTSKQGKPNENQKREGTALTLGKRRSKKEKAQPAEGVRRWGMLAFFLEKGATYLTNNKKGGEIGDRLLASKPARPRGIKRSLLVLTWISGDGKRRMRTPVLILLGWWLGPFCGAVACFWSIEHE